MGLVVFLILIFVSSVWFFKERLTFYAIKGKFGQIFPRHEFLIRQLSIEPGFFALPHFDIRPKKSTVPLGFELKGGSAVAHFSTLRLFGDPFLCVDHVFLSAKSLRVDPLMFSDLNSYFFRPFPGSYLNLFLSIKKLQEKDMTAKNFVGHLRLSPRLIIIDNMKMSALSGTLSGSGRMSNTEKGWVLDLTVHFENMDISDLMKGLAMDRSVKASGVFRGDIVVGLENNRIRYLSGYLSCVKGGEVNVSSDAKWSNIVVENLKNYRYDIGNVKVSNDNQDIRIDVSLEGGAGVRNLRVFWHRYIDQSR